MYPNNFLSQNYTDVFGRNYRISINSNVDAKGFLNQQRGEFLDYIYSQCRSNKIPIVFGAISGILVLESQMKRFIRYEFPNISKDLEAKSRDYKISNLEAVFNKPDNQFNTHYGKIYCQNQFSRKFKAFIEAKQRNQFLHLDKDALFLLHRRISDNDIFEFIQNVRHFCILFPIMHMRVVATV